MAKGLEARLAVLERKLGSATKAEGSGSGSAVEQFVDHVFEEHAAAAALPIGDVHRVKHTRSQLVELISSALASLGRAKET